MLLLISAPTLGPGNTLEVGGGWRLTIKRKCQLLPYRVGREEAVGLHSNMKVESGMLLLMSGSTLAPGINLQGGGMEPSNKREMSAASLYRGDGGGS